MSDEQKPDGWILYDDEHQEFAVKYWEDYVVKTRNARLDVFPIGFSYKPVCLISPQELARLRRVEDLVKCANDEFESSRLKDNDDIWDILQDVLQGYDALTAPVEGKS